MGCSLTTPAVWVLAEGIHRDITRLWRRHRAEKACPDFTPTPNPEQMWAVVEVSNLSGSVVRYWRGTDRDKWTPHPDKARLFRTDSNAIRAAEEHMLDVYRPSYRVVVLP